MSDYICVYVCFVIHVRLYFSKQAFRLLSDLQQHLLLPSFFLRGQFEKMNEHKYHPQSLNSSAPVAQNKYSTTSVGSFVWSLKIGLGYMYIMNYIGWESIDWIGLDWVEWDWFGMNWIELAWIEICRIELDWSGVNCLIGLGCIGLDWVELDWFRLVWIRFKLMCACVLCKLACRLALYICLFGDVPWFVCNWCQLAHCLALWMLGARM